MQRIDVRISFLWLSNLAVFAFLGALGGCIAAPTPYEEYNFARAAVKAAQDVDSARYATGLWNKAEQNYRSGQKEYRENDFAEAKKHFLLAIQFAEKAENATRLKKFQTGDSYP